jgi:hypothetical protein
MIKKPIVILFLLLLTACVYISKKQVEDLRKEHDVDVSMSFGVFLSDLLGGCSPLLVYNMDKELSKFPDSFKEDLNLEIISRFDLLFKLESPFDIFMFPFVQGVTLGDGTVCVLNKTVWGYLFLVNPNVTMVRDPLLWIQDPYLRHEMMHHIDLGKFSRELFKDGYEKFLKRGTRYSINTMDSICLMIPDEYIEDNRREYVLFCSRWAASFFGDIDGDGVIDDVDRLLLRDGVGKYDRDGDGLLTPDDASWFFLKRYSGLGGSNPLVILEATLGLIYRPSGFASMYGRINRMEDRAEVLMYCVSRDIYPINSGTPRKIKKLRKRDIVLARKVEIMCEFFGRF